MKNKFLIVFMLIVSVFSLVGCGDSESVVRIHIRANSNNEVDQNIKLEVRDAVIDYITPLIAECGNSEEVKDILNLNLNNITGIANSVLDGSDFEYGSRAELKNEYFPSRSYNGEVYPADYYDALIIELGTGKGDNWWCVAYPPLCFVGENMGNNIRYKSKLLELISKFFGD